MVFKHQMFACKRSLWELRFSPSLAVTPPQKRYKYPLLPV